MKMTSDALFINRNCKRISIYLAFYSI